MDEKKPRPDTGQIGQKSKKTQKSGEKPEEEKEIGGFADNGLLDPVRYGDWEVKGRCSDF